MKPHSCKDRFSTNITNNILTITRTDAPTGWIHTHECILLLKTNEKILLFQEVVDNGDWVRSYVLHNSTKLLDSRDIDYHTNKGW